MPQLPGAPASPARASSQLRWLEADQACCARWRSERGSAPPQRVVLADDTTTADNAYHLACAGTALLWRGDFQNARQLLQAMARRIDQVPRRKHRKSMPEIPVADTFNRHRLAQSQRSRTLGMLLIEFGADYSIDLRRAPDVKTACTEAWGAADPTAGTSVASLRELLGVRSAHEWRRVGVEIPALGAAPHNRVHPHYGVFSPVRGEYVQLVANAHLPKPPKGQDGIVAFDIGTGTGVLAAVLARRGISHIVATDQEPRALVCARDNLARLGVEQQVEVLEADLFPPGLASLIVCNPPWLPGRPGSPLEHAVYDEGSRMLNGFLKGLRAHLAAHGEGWLIMSNLAELLGLRSREALLERFAEQGLRVVSRIDTTPVHPKASDTTDALYQARCREVTSLWRLAVLSNPAASTATEADLTPQGPVSA